MLITQRDYYINKLLYSEWKKSLKTIFWYLREYNIEEINRKLSGLNQKSIDEYELEERLLQLNKKEISNKFNQERIQFFKNKKNNHSFKINRDKKKFLKNINNDLFEHMNVYSFMCYLEIELLNVQNLKTIDILNKIIESKNEPIIKALCEHAKSHSDIILQEKIIEAYFVYLKICRPFSPSGFIEESEKLMSLIIGNLSIDSEKMRNKINKKFSELEVEIKNNKESYGISVMNPSLSFVELITMLNKIKDHANILIDKKELDSLIKNNMHMPQKKIRL